jgi:hypothetical protein
MRHPNAVHQIDARPPESNVPTSGLASATIRATLATVPTDCLADRTSACASGSSYYLLAFILAYKPLGDRGQSHWGNVLSDFFVFGYGTAGT